MERKFLNDVGKETIILIVTGVIFIGCALGIVWSDWIKEIFTKYPKLFTCLSWMTIGCSAYVCYSFWKKMKKKIQAYKFEDNFYPTMMVAQGTYYTFIGISAILITFGANDNGNQFTEVRGLLAGLRLAFITSVIGLISSIIAKMYMKKKAIEYQESTPNQEYVLIEDDQMYRALIDIKNTLNNQGNMLKEVQHDLLDESQKNVIKTVEKLTNDIGECIEKRITQALEANTAAVNAAIKENSDAFIEAIKNCNSQFLSSFTEYRQALQVAIEEIETTTMQAKKINRQLLDDMSNITTTVNDTCRMVSGLSDTMERMRAEYEQSGKYFTSTMVEFERLNLPTLMTEFKTIMEQVTGTMRNAIDSGTEIRALVEQFRDIGGNLAAIKYTMDNYQNKIIDDAKLISKKQEELIGTLNTLNEDYYRNLNNAQNKFKENLCGLANDFAKVLKEQHDQVKNLSNSVERIHNKIEETTKSSSNDNDEIDFGRI